MTTTTRDDSRNIINVPIDRCLNRQTKSTIESRNRQSNLEIDNRQTNHKINTRNRIMSHLALHSRAVCHYAEGGATEAYCNRAVCQSVCRLQVFLVAH